MPDVTHQLLSSVGAPAPLRGADVGAARERTRRRRLWWIAALLTPLMVWMWWRVLTGDPVGPPSMPTALSDGNPSGLRTV